MELLLIRHGRPHPVPAGDSAADPELDEIGQLQASRIATVLAAGMYGTVSRIVSSTMRRALQTAEPMARLTGLALDSDARLVELDAGATRYGGDGFAGFTSREQAWSSVNDGNWDGHRFDPIAFRQRVVDGVEDAVAAALAAQDSTIAIFCHGGVISAYLGHVLGMGRSLFCAPDYTSITRVLAGTTSHREMLSFNERAHLPAG